MTGRLATLTLPAGVSYLAGGGGLVTSTLLTLILIPVLYTMAESRRERRRARKTAVTPQPAPAEPAAVS